MTSITGNERGFVLAELLVVLLIFATILAVSAPMMNNSYREAGFRAAARALTARLAYAHRQSIIKGKQVRVVIDSRDRTSWIETEERPGIFRAEQSTLENKQKFPANTTLSMTDSSAAESGRDVENVTFFPDGTAEPRDIIVRNSENNIYEITVHPATGSVAAKKI